MVDLKVTATKIQESLFYIFSTRNRIKKEDESRKAKNPRKDLDGSGRSLSEVGTKNTVVLYYLFLIKND